jgi:transposase-like protein
MTRPKRNDETIQVTKQDLMRMLTEDDAMKSLLQTLLQEVLEAEMDEALRAGKNERTSGRLGYRSGHYPRTLVTRVGKLELRVPQDRQGRFSTELFARYQRSEKALVAALMEMYVQGVVDPAGEDDHRGTVRARVQCECDQCTEREDG